MHKYDVEVIKSGAVTQSTPAKTKDSYSEKTYTVVKGDTLYSISKKTNVSLEELKRKNNLKDNSLAIGQTLRL